MGRCPRAFSAERPPFLPTVQPQMGSLGPLTAQVVSVLVVFSFLSLFLPVVLLPRSEYLTAALISVAIDKTRSSKLAS